MQTWSDADLTAYSAHLRERCRGGDTLDSLLPEAFALVREACQRKLGKRHFDVQLLGGMALHDGVIAEMGTGEGKSLTGVLPAYLNALTGETVFVATVNDYLAKRDADVFRPVFAMLNMQARSRSRFVGAGRSWRGRSDACAPRWAHRTWTVLGSAQAHAGHQRCQRRRHHPRQRHLHHSDVARLRVPERCQRSVAGGA